MSNLLSTASAARLLGISVARVRKLVGEGRLAAEKHGRDLLLREEDCRTFLVKEKRGPGRPVRGGEPPSSGRGEEVESWRNVGDNLICGDAFEVLPTLPEGHYQMVLADPPYFQVLKESWDHAWSSEEGYLDWTVAWVRECKRVLREDGLLYVFGQLGKREHVWLHLCSALSREMQFHDMIVWDRAVGYNERSDSFTPQYENVLVLRKTKTSKPYFNKDAVRIPYPEETIRTYLKDKRYKDLEARERHLRKGKYATNILRVPSLKGISKEKVGHPSQKPIALIRLLISASTREGDRVLDPFSGSGTTAVAAEELGRSWTGIEVSPEYARMAEKRILGARSALKA